MNVSIFHGKLYFQELIEFVCLFEGITKARILKLLEEYYQELGQSNWIVILHSNMAISVETPSVALNQER